MEYYYLRVAGYLYGSGNKCIYLMDNSPQHKILLMFVMKFDERRRVASYSAVDETGTEKFLVIKTFDEDNIERYTVRTGSQQIGVWEMNNGNGRITIQTFNEFGDTTIQGNTQKVNKHTHCQFKTALGNKVCDMFNHHRGTFNIALARLLDEKVKNLLFFVGVFVVHVRVVGSRFLFKTSISILQNGLKMKTRKPKTLGTAPEITNLLQSYNLIIALVGHDSLKNIVYFNIHLKNNSTVHATIEVTPVKDYQGYAQMVIKDAVGSTLCTAVHFARHEITTFYNDENSLFAYRQHMRIFDIRSQPVLELIDLRTNRHLTLGTPRVTLKYVHPTFNYRIAGEIGIKAGGMKIFKCPSQGNYTFHQMIGILALSMHRELSLNYSGNLSPEIKYFYFNRKPATHSYIF